MEKLVCNQVEKSGVAKVFQGEPNDPSSGKTVNDDDIHTLTKLLGDGISDLDLQRIKEKGFYTVESVAFASIKSLTSIKGISEVKARKLWSKAKVLIPTGFTSGLKVFNKRQELIYITTGSKALDNLLQGGFETGSMVEIFGEASSGKTQLCTNLCVTVQLPVEKGGAEAKAMYIDTHGTFRSERIIAIAHRFGLDVEKVLDNVTVAKAYNSDHQEKLLIMANALLSESRYGIVVVDSITGLLRTDYTGRGELYDRQAKLGQMLKFLRRMCDEYGVACIYTNEVMSDVSGGFLFGGDVTKPIGGNVLAHAATTRLQLRKAKGDTRICKVSSSPILPESEAKFNLTVKGIEDFTE